jgi:SAM-dependent methyltransferase
MKKGTSPLFFKDYYYEVRYRCSFKKLSQSTAKPESLILEAGCGKRSVISELNLKVKNAVGVDISPVDLQQNTAMDFRLLADIGKLPFKKDTFDLIICRNVVEHLPDPINVFTEFRMVLRPQGMILIRTPNLLNPIIFLSRILPLNIRIWIKKSVFHDTDGDTFPTYHRCNTKRRLINTFTSLGFQSNFLTYDGLMAYFDFSRILLSLIVLYERITDIRCLRWLKMWIITSFIKP